MMKTSENYTFSNCDLDSNSVVSKCIISPVTHREKFFRIRVEISPEIKVEDDMLRKSMLLVEPESTHTVADLRYNIIRKMALDIDPENNVESMSLNIDGYSLLPFESIYVVRDGDIISISRSSTFKETVANCSPSTVQNQVVKKRSKSSQKSSHKSGSESKTKSTQLKEVKNADQHELPSYTTPKITDESCNNQNSFNKSQSSSIITSFSPYSSHLNSSKNKNCLFAQTPVPVLTIPTHQPQPSNIFNLNYSVSKSNISSPKLNVSSNGYSTNDKHSNENKESKHAKLNESYEKVTERKSSHTSINHHNDTDVTSFHSNFINSRNTKKHIKFDDVNDNITNLACNDDESSISFKHINDSRNSPQMNDLAILNKSPHNNSLQKLDVKSLEDSRLSMSHKRKYEVLASIALNSCHVKSSNTHKHGSNTLSSSNSVNNTSPSVISVLERNISHLPSVSNVNDLKCKDVIAYRSISLCPDIKQPIISTNFSFGRISAIIGNSNNKDENTSNNKNSNIYLKVVPLEYFNSKTSSSEATKANMNDSENSSSISLNDLVVIQPKSTVTLSWCDFACIHVIHKNISINMITEGYSGRSSISNEASSNNNTNKDKITLPNVYTLDDDIMKLLQCRKSTLQ